MKSFGYGNAPLHVVAAVLAKLQEPILVICKGEEYFQIMKIALWIDKSIW